MEIIAYFQLSESGFRATSKEFFSEELHGIQGDVCLSYMLVSKSNPRVCLGPREEQMTQQLIFSDSLKYHAELE